MKKTLKAIGIAFSLLCIASLTLPAFTVLSNDTTLRGFSLAEFSAWGAIIPVIPVILIEIMLCKLRDSTKTICIVILQLLAAVSLYCSHVSAYDWICKYERGYIRPHANDIIYAAMLILSCISFLISCNSSCEIKKPIRVLFSKLTEPDDTEGNE